MLLAILLSLFAIPQQIKNPFVGSGYNQTISHVPLSIPIAAQSSSQTFSGCTVSIANGVVTITCPVSQPPLTIMTPVALPPATVGVPYTVNLAALVKPAGGTPPYKFKDVTGFPAWTRLTPDGILSGTPTAPCSCVLKFNVSDSSGQTVSVTTPATKGVPLNVQPQGPRITATAVPAGSR